MKHIVTLSRIFVSGLFIFSGLIKLNDPLGFAYKLEEYFSEDVLNMEFLIPYALTLSIVIVIFEVVVGVMLLLGKCRKFTLWSLLLMIVFFTFLTFYSAYFNKVTDCGCFGDAIKLTPWESFTKDVILLGLILILFFGRKYIKPIFTSSVRNILLLVSVLFCVYVVFHVLNHLPFIDFRAYKVGTNIPEAMSYPPDAKKPIYDYDWKFNINGKEEIITTQGSYPQVEGEYISVETRLVQEGYTPPIMDFNIEDKEGSRMEEFMEKDKLLMVLVYNAEKANPKGFKGIKELTDKAAQQGYTVIGLTATDKHIDQLKSEHGLGFDFYFCDEKVLKTMARSNPAVLKLNRGTIVQKVHWRDVESIEY